MPTNSETTNRAANCWQCNAPAMTGWPGDSFAHALEPRARCTDPECPMSRPPWLSLSKWNDQAAEHGRIDHIEVELTMAPQEGASQ